MVKNCITNLRHKEFYPLKGTGYEGFIRGYFYVENQYVTHENFTTIYESGLINPSEIATWNGEFALILKREDEITLVTDKKRSIPLFYSYDETNNEWLVQDHLQPSTSMSIQKEAAEELLLAGFVTGDKTLFSGWHQLEVATIVRLSEHASKHAYYSYVVEKESDSIDTFADELAHILHNIFDDLAVRLAGRKIVLPLSGGYDSRIMALMLKEKGLSDSIITFTYGRPGNGEATVSKEIADRLGLKWKYFAYDKAMWENLYKSQEWKDYVLYACNGTSVAHLQDFPSTKLLVEEEKLDNAVFLPGHSLDFLGGSHLPYEATIEKQFTTKEVVDFIVPKHFRLWQLSGGLSQENSEIGKSVTQDVAAYTNLTNERVTSIIDEWNWKERQGKFIINSVRVYEYFDQDWSMPLWDDRLIYFFSKIPVNLKYKKYLYDYTLHKMYPDFYTLPQRPGPENSLKNKYGLLYPLLRKVYRKKKLYRQYYDEPMEWYGIYPTYKQYVQALSFKRGGNKYEQPYNINSFIAKDMIEMMEEMTK
ncbi:asparagine synthase C-terminal domain-containing protein [Psychrobacillus sp.]|uniref:asparagine synthase C-terminal domain-containing protein n=1 Tax=Psychrobacillus sp. TaxID=1871623 RepID=UPI0028BE71CD|nr:asparagine synthase C-terminal domain-containing protein [Psychrobacillus sp.]